MNEALYDLRVKIKAAIMRRCVKHILEGDYSRADQGVECPECGRTYQRHPEIEGYPTFVLVCSGAIYKL